MKKRILIATTFLMSLMTGSGSFHALAQNEPYALVKIGASEEFATRNAKGAVTDYQLVKVTGNGKNGDTLIVTREITLLDKNHKPSGKVKTITSHLKVIRGQVIDDTFTELILSSIGYAIADYNMTDEQKKEASMGVSGEVGRLPAVLAPCAKLPDSQMDISFVDGKINMHVNNYGRKVLGRETITTSAGTFDCVVLEEYLSLNVLVISEKTRKKTWYAPGIGEIRTEVWNKGRKSGAPDSVMTLTRLQK